MTFADRKTELTTSVISKYLMSLLETIYENVEINFSGNVINKIQSNDLDPAIVKVTKRLLEEE